MTAAQTEISLYPEHHAPANMNMYDEALHRRATEVAIWATPLMNYKAMYDSLHDVVGMQMNDIVYHSKIQDWKRALPTPSSVTPYGNLYWDLTDGPIVVEIPPTSAQGVGLFGTLLDSWHRPLTDYGVNTGEDGGRGAKYLIVPEHYQGQLPNGGGYHVIKQKNNLGWTLIRAIIKDKSEASLQKAVAQFRKIKVYPYAERNHPKPNNYIDLVDKKIDGIVKYTPDYFSKLHEILSQDIIEQKDMAMLGMLQAMDIKIGAPYTTNAKRDAIFDDALKDAHEYMVSRYHGQEMIPVYYKDKKWGPIVPPSYYTHRFDWDYASHLDYDRRGAFSYATFSSVKNYGPGNFFLDTSMDSDGQWLEGEHNYKLTVPANVPVKQFWAVTAYDMETAAFIEDMPRQGLGSTTTSLVTNSDGTVDMYIGPKAPKGKEANWIPTKAGRKFFLLFRFYGNEKEVFTKEWQLNDVEKLN
ncbi:DUF1214 domain-containing protein [Colwellia piezophila]|uniref:DUF1214 domain-containing protein n=1 Tax=Colwellia piezophila TaxID=211668 RepID=UPI00037CF01E|nr:DUF1254 domain-containing protein [Colwellia piezophila]